MLDRQSVRTASQPGLRGSNAGKTMTGRKRHVLVDTLGFILSVKVTPADVQDRDGARLLMAVLTTTSGWLKLISADGGKAGQWVGEVAPLKRHPSACWEVATDPYGRGSALRDPSRMTMIIPAGDGQTDGSRIPESICSLWTSRPR
ncbi:transposase [Haloferula luteola]